MAKKSDAPAPNAAPPRVFKASLGADGAVLRAEEIGFAAAVARRRAGDDVVVCGPELAANRRLAAEIELDANGSAERDPPHQKRAGPSALPHFQPKNRPPAGHTFYETPHLRAKRAR